MAKKRSRGEGTLTQLLSGNWRAQVSLHGRRLSHTSPTQAGARDWIRKMRDQIDMGLTYDDERTTVARFMESWLALKKTELRIATFEHYTWMSKLHLLPNLGKIRLKDLTPGMVQNCYDKLAAEGVGVRSIRASHVVLHGFLEHAMHLGLITRNPTEFARPPRQEKRDLNIWDEDQVMKFLGFIQGHKNDHLYYLALTTGMRRGELLGLKWQDVDWSHSKLLIKRQVFHPQGGGFIFQPPKTKLGRRQVQLSSGAMQHLREQIKRVDLMRASNPGSWKEHDLVFPSLMGTPMGDDNLTHEFQELVAASGLPRIRFHDMRHTAASILLSRGIQPVIVAGMLGHSLSILLSTYAHYIPGTQEEAARVMDEVTTPIKFIPPE